MKIKIGISNRHIHLTQEHFEILFGKEETLEVSRTLTQPGEFASTKYVTLKTKKSEIEKVRVLGPTRSYTQVEISKTDAYKLGLNPPVRNSGDIKDSAPITIIGEKGSIDLKEGCIIPIRHIHVKKDDLEKYGLQNGEEVSVEIHSEKGGVLNHVYIKAMDDAYFELHVDTDDGNGFLMTKETEGEILKHE